MPAKKLSAKESIELLKKQFERMAAVNQLISKHYFEVIEYVMGLETVIQNPLLVTIKNGLISLQEVQLKELKELRK